MSKGKKKVEYREVQRFREWDVFILLSLFVLGLAYRAVAGYMGWWGAPGEASFSTYLLLTLVVGLVFLYLYSIRVLLVVNKKGVRYQFYPWHFRKHKIDWDEVADWQIVDIPLQAALSGWSVNFSCEKCFSVNGRRKGLELDFRDGKRIFISSTEPERLRKIIKRLQKNDNGMGPAQSLT